jgi:predicted nucleic acid-binding protein
MKIYLDACCLNRPFDEQSQQRIRLEAEAILIILNHLYNHEWEWIGSEALEIEIENTPNIEKRYSLMRLAACVHKLMEIREGELDRAKQLEEIGFKPFDAMHISCAESGKADILFTTDDKFLKTALKMRDKLNIRVANPLQWITELLLNENRTNKSLSDSSDGY